MSKQWTTLLNDVTVFRALRHQRNNKQNHYFCTLYLEVFKYRQGLVLQKNKKQQRDSSMRKCGYSSRQLLVGKWLDTPLLENRDKPKSKPVFKTFCGHKYFFQTLAVVHLYYTNTNQNC